MPTLGRVTAAVVGPKTGWTVSLVAVRSGVRDCSTRRPGAFGATPGTLVSTGLTTAGRAAEGREPASAVSTLAVADPVPPLMPEGARVSGLAVVSVRALESSTGIEAS